MRGFRALQHKPEAGKWPIRAGQHQREVSDQGAGESVQMVIVIIREEDEQSRVWKTP